MELLENRKYFIDFIKEFESYSTEIHKPKEIKKAAKYLTHSLKNGEISEDIFEELIEILLASYLQYHFEKKFLHKESNLHRYFFNFGKPREFVNE
ncbi:MAG: hypothetical protein RBT49_09305 [Bacteroidales bacterium]|jgi:hypothetical protein|nr:hypothetical protein [Bacteroidales bacterium]